MSIIRLDSPTKLARKLLWTNPNPSQAFASQTVQTPGLLNYDEVWVYVKGHISYPNGSLHKVITHTGANVPAVWVGMSASWSYIWQREINAYQQNIAFSDAFTKNLLNTAAATVDNDRLVPYQVYGVNYS